MCVVCYWHRSVYMYLCVYGNLGTSIFRPFERGQGGGGGFYLGISLQAWGWGGGGVQILNREWVCFMSSTAVTSGSDATSYVFINYFNRS
jgi:hypothetical protein